MTDSAKELRLGTRGSALALWQAEAVRTSLTRAGGPPCRIVVIKTSGDRLQEAPLSELGGKRLFVKEIEDALLRDEIDLAVHSSKDLPAVLPDGLTIAGVLPREDPLDAVVLPQGVRLKPDTTPDVASGFSRTMTIKELLDILGPHATIGTGSVRRIAQLARLMPGARFAPIRGNLDTRLRKLDAGEHDALVLAAAGLRRLGFTHRISLTLPATACVPAPGQGIVAIEIRARDDQIRQVLEAITDGKAMAALRAERSVVERLGGGCQMPLGALATPVGENELDIVAAVFSLDGRRVARTTARGRTREAQALGARVGTQLIADGAEEILADARRT